MDLEFEKMMTDASVLDSEIVLGWVKYYVIITKVFKGSDPHILNFVLFNNIK